MILVGLTSYGLPVLAQQTTVTPVPESSSALESERTPKGALWRAAAIPGWGQIYNRQYVKLPFVYGAIGGLAYLAIVVDGKYRDYQRAYLYKAYQERVDAGLEEVNEWSHYKPSYDEIVAQFGQLSSSPLRNQRDAYRRNRDLSILGATLVYGLTILDAYVSAHLLDFDIDENLSLRIVPTPEGVSWKANLALR